MSKKSPLPKGWRKCMRCKEPFQTGSSPVPRSCSGCHSDQSKKSHPGYLKCIRCKTQFKRLTKHQQFCSSECSALTQREKRNTLIGRLRLCLHKAKARRTCDIDLEWLVKQWYKQNGKCYYTGWEMQLNSESKALHPTLERLDSNKDYVPDNVVICCRQANWAKCNYTIEEFINMCNAVTINFGK